MLRKTGHTVKAAIKIREGITNSHPMRVFRSSRCFFVCVFIFYSPFIRFRENSKNMKQIGAAVKHDSTNFIIGFSRLRTLEFFVFRKMEMSETKNHPLCGWSQQCYTKNHLSVRIELFRLLC